MVSFRIRRAVLVQIGSAIVVNLCALMAGAWLTWPSSVIKPLLAGEVCCKATEEQISLMVSLMDLGNMLTPIPAAFLVDTFGRKPIIHSTALMFLVASACVMFANDMTYIFIGRMFAGMGKGIAFGVIPLFMAEIADINIRGALCSMFSTFVSLGISFDYIFGAIFQYQGLNVTNCIVTMVFAIALFFIPESPYYLSKKGRDAEAERNLAFYRQLNVTDDMLRSEMEVIKKSVAADMKNKARFVDVVTTKSRRRALMIVSVLALLQRLSGISPLLVYKTITLPESGGGLSKDIYAIIFSFLLIVGNYTSMPFVDIWGRKKLLILSFVSCAFVTGAFAVFNTVSWSYDVTAYNWIPYACLLMFALTWSCGLSIIPSTLVGELFPLNVKTYANAIQSIMYAAASLSINEVFMPISSKYGVQVMFIFFTASSIVGAVFTALFVFETKGKTFTEIQNKLREVTDDIDLEVYTINK